MECVNLVMFAVMDAALKLHSIMANLMAGSWLQKGGARNVRREGQGRSEGRGCHGDECCSRLHAHGVW